MRTSTRRRTLRPSAAEPEDAVREMFDLEHHAGQNHSSSEWQFLSPELARMGEGRSGRPHVLVEQQARAMLLVSAGLHRMLSLPTPQLFLSAGSSRRLCDSSGCAARVALDHLSEYAQHLAELTESTTQASCQQPHEACSLTAGSCSMLSADNKGCRARAIDREAFCASAAQLHRVVHRPQSS